MKIKRDSGTVVVKRTFIKQEVCLKRATVKVLYVVFYLPFFLLKVVAVLYCGYSL